MKKIIVTFSLLLCALLTLSACTSNQEEKTSVKQQLEKENIKVTIEESKDFSASEIEKAMQVVIDKIKKNTSTTS